jgi:5-methylcytosine-specific restriction endonuclease McrA
MSLNQSQKVLRKFKGRCFRCPNPATQVHEIEPRSSGRGKLVFENQVALCTQCHMEIHQKGATSFVEELKELRQSFLEKYATSEAQKN